MTDTDQSHNERDTQAVSYSTWSLEPYSELRTMPVAWDLSELLGAPQTSKNGKLRPETPPAAASSSEAGFSSEECKPGGWHPEPFPEPKTYPAHWDFSE
jgi:hypothetical protein